MRVTDATLAALAPAGIAAALRSSAFDPASAGLAPRDAALLSLARDAVASWLADADRVPPAELIDRVIAETAYMFELGGARLSQARENVKKVRALVRRVQNRGYATFGRLADYFERLDTGEEANAIIAARGAVQLMTVHSAKGLEFPIVFLVRMNAGAGGATPAISVVPKGAEDQPDVAISMRSPSASLESARDAEESRRLFYVAMTRARDRLYFAAEFPEDKKPGPGSFAKLLPTTLLATLGDAVATSADRVTWTSARGQTFDFEVCRPDPAPPQPARAPQPNTLPVELGTLDDTDVPRTAATEWLAASDNAAVAVTAETSPPSDRAVGTLVHRLFQHGVVPGPGAEAWAQSLITPDDLARSEAPDAAALAARAVAMYSAMRDRPDVTDTLASGQVFYEVPFSIRTGTPPRVVRGQIDALVVPASGPVVVVEFKTGAPRPEHDAQLALYREAVRAAWPADERGAPREVITRLFYF
jgi:ATP-dependent exoDNAse (exonuclease V) beta subunit